MGRQLKPSLRRCVDAFLRILPFIGFLLILSGLLSGQTMGGFGLVLLIVLWPASILAWLVARPKSNHR
jgi:hypothetical protein